MHNDFDKSPAGCEKLLHELTPILMACTGKLRIIDALTLVHLEHCKD
jgi:hypothetical protein